MLIVIIRLASYDYDHFMNGFINFDFHVLVHTVVVKSEGKRSKYTNQKKFHFHPIFECTAKKRSKIQNF